MHWEVIKSRLAGRSFRALDKDPFGSKVLERYVDSIASEIKTEKNSRIMKVLSVYLKLSSEKKVKTKLSFCTRHLQRDVTIKKGVPGWDLNFISCLKDVQKTKKLFSVQDMCKER